MAPDKMASITNVLPLAHVMGNGARSTHSQHGHNAEQNARLLSPQGENDSTGIPSVKPGSEYINIGLDDQCEIFGYCRSLLRTTVTWLMILLTGGFLRLFFHWNPELMLRATHKQCPLMVATRILIVEHYKKYRRSFVKEVFTISADKIQFADNYTALNSGISQVEKSQHELTDISAENNAQNFVKLNENYITNCLIVPSVSGEMKYVQEIRWFSCKKNSYVWDQDKASFYRLQGLDSGYSPEDIHGHRGLSWLGQMQRRIVYGENSIQVPVTPVLRLLFLEVLNPFYIFQMFSVLLWYIDDYVYYATVIVITSVLSIISEVYQMHQNQVTLRSTIQSSDVVEVIRDTGNIDAIPSEHLVPGDVIVLPPQGCVMHCDAVLLQGNTIVNESMLTGESVPVTKTPLPNKCGVKFTEKEHGRHILFCGTNVIQTRFYGKEKVTAVVIRTGFLTSKGNLVRSIMYPPPVDFKFVQDAYRFILFLVGIASFGFVFTVVTKAMRGLTVRAIAVDSLDLITIVVPPALPMAMTVGILYALGRLKKNKIFCISPRSINISGVLNCICFDKTGTLTEDGLDMKGVIRIVEQTGDLGELCYPAGNETDHLTCGMAACHSITIINKNMIGDPLDLKMFESTGWALEEPGLEDTSKYDMIIPSVVRPSTSTTDPNGTHEKISLEIGILRQFPFSSSLQRMSVVTREISDSNFSLYCKGAPEMIASLSRPETVPANFTSVLLSFTNEGYRVLALSWKPLKLPYAKIQRISREEAETDLIFLGLLVLENRLKAETTPVIRQLKKANIRTVMVTGDNILTALSVGRECELVDGRSKVITVKTSLSSDGSYKVSYESTLNPFKDNASEVSLDVEGPQYCFAIEGKSWSIINTQFPDILKRILVRGSVFARMNPEQKQQLISGLQQVGYYVGMCGDGANDCGALKLAHAGISLSEAEASVASPFTSKNANISCVPTLIREGRTALVTSFGVFKYMATYSLTQFVSVMILYSIDSNLTDFQFLYIDLFLITIFAFFFGRTASYDGDLAPRPPASSLISAAPLLSILLHITVVIGFQTFGFFYVQNQPWFLPFNATTSEEILAGHENYAVFSLSQFQYIILAVVFSTGAPYRKPLYTNYILISSIVVMTGFSIYLTLYPGQYIVNLFEMVFPPESVGMFFRWQIILLAVINSILALFIELFIVEYLLNHKLKSKFSNVRNPKKKYRFIEKEMRSEKNWPPLMEDKCQTYTSITNGRATAASPSTNGFGRKIVPLTEYHSSL